MPVVFGDIMRAKPKTLGEYIVELQIKDAVLNADVGALIDAWRLRFGTRWVDDEELSNDPFYSQVAATLGKTSHLESHMVVDQNKLRCRLVERW